MAAETWIVCQEREEKRKVAKRGREVGGERRESPHPVFAAALCQILCDEGPFLLQKERERRFIVTIGLLFLSFSTNI